MRKTSLPYIL